MAKISPRVSCFILLQCFSKILSAQVQPSLAQYLQLAALGPQELSMPSPPSFNGLSPSFPSSPGYGPSPKYQTGYQNPPNYQTPSKLTSTLPKPTIPLPLSPITNLAASLSVPNPSLQKTPTVPKASGSLQSSGLDSNVLNNLAIALQLLIVSNILSMPAENTPNQLSVLELPKFEPIRKYESLPISSLPLSSYPVQSVMPLRTPIPYLESPKINPLYSLDKPILPNSNFLGSSGFIEPNMFGSASAVRPNPRSSLTLMSPYEAIGPNSPFSDPILSSVYSPSYSKKDFQSPYASILASDGNSDLFSASDLF